MEQVQDLPQHRYDAELAGELERTWQETWARLGTFHVPNPVGSLAPPDGSAVPADKMFVQDMFPYPSGEGLHVGHPLGYIATDVYARYFRMTGRNVLHALGFDAFGLPAEQYAVQTGTHPRTRTEANIVNFRRQLGRLGLGHDARRSFATTDVDFYKWTQWIFLQIFNAWFDPELNRARRIDELIAEFDSGARTPADGRVWAQLSAGERADVVDGYRLVYRSDSMVNWCPGLGTVLANEEVTADGRSDRGNFPVFRKRLRQWMMRITAYSDRLLDDLDVLDWPDKVKAMQRNWIGRSMGAAVLFGTDTSDIEVFTTRPDTLFGATYMVLAPEHELVDALVAGQWPEGTDERWTFGAATPVEAVAAYRASVAAKSDLERQENKSKTGVFIGAFATNPVNGARIPVFIADYVLAGYGTGAIMAVPSGDQRDWEFATAFGLPIVEVVSGGDVTQGAYHGDGVLVNSGYLDGLSVASAKEAIVARLEADGRGHARIEYKLRDWLFARQRYWGEPFPIVYDDEGRAHALPESALPVELPDIAGLRAGAVRPRRRRHRAVAAVGEGHRLGQRRTRPRRRAEALHPRHQRDAAVGGQLVVRAALRRPAQLGDVLRQGERGVLDGSAAGRTRCRRSRRRRPVRRRRRARRAAPAVLAVLAQGALRPGARELPRALPTAGQPGLHPGVRLHRLRAAATCPPRKSLSARESSTGQAPKARSRSTRSSARSARA